MRHIIVRFVREVGFADAVSDGGCWSWGCYSCGEARGCYS